MRDVPMERTAGVIILCVTLIFGLWEFRGIVRSAPGDTWSEWLWPWMLQWPGAFVCAFCAWLLWHLPFARYRGIGWPDLVAVAAGVGLWFIARNNQGAP